MELAEKLKVVLASTFALYLKTHFYHWNIVSHNFYSLHKLFNKQYEELYESVDVLAELIRTLNAFAPGSFERFAELSIVKTTSTVVSDVRMLEDLSADHQAMIDLLTSAFHIAESVYDQAVMNRLAERLEAHKKHLWMINATLMKK